MRASLLALALMGCAAPMEPAAVGDGGNAREAWSDGMGNRVEAFQWGPSARNAVVDYLFVVDNSVSMKKVVRRVRKGFRSMGPDDFPSQARIAVINTLPGEIDHPERLHPAVPMSELGDDAGFGQLIDGASIRRAAAVPAIASAFTEPGCDAWFRPGDKNANGVPCLVAHTQVSHTPTMAEAGLTAVKQLLERNRGKATFRPGATVNIVFVSDTHDPGITSGPDAIELMENRPTASELGELIAQDNVVSALRFHAIAPETECVEKWSTIGPSYFDAVEATGGARLDMCTVKNYRRILDTATDEGARPNRKVFALGERATQVEEVLVDGEPVQFEVVGARVVLTEADQLTPDVDHDVEVRFQTGDD